MRLEIIQNLSENLNDETATRRFIEVLEMRQRTFRGEHRPNLVLLDQYDLICDHVLLRSDRDGKLMAYIRSIPRRSCEKYALPFPMTQLLNGRREYEFGYRAFNKRAVAPLHMGYLCLDPAYRDELKGAKAIDLLVWLGFMVSGIPLSECAFTATINNRYKQDASMRLLGDWIPNLPDIQHALVADPHRVVLVPRISDAYWKGQRAKFAALYPTLGEIGDGFLREDSGIAA